MRSFLQDVRYALRTFRTAPGFTIAVLLMLAVGIGANTVIFSVINSVLLSPPKFRYLDRMAFLFEANRKIGRGDADTGPSPADFLDWRKQSKSFDQMAAWRNWYYSLSGPESSRDVPESVRGVRISANFFAMLGVDFAVGRGFRDEEERAGRDQVVVLASSVWKRHFGGDSAVLGSQVRIDGRPYTVVGILPDDFCFLQPDLELWMPLNLDAEADARNDRSLLAFGRLAPGVSIAQAKAELGSLAAQLERAHPESNAGWGANVLRLYPSQYFNANARSLRSALLMLFGAVGLVLLIACANVANLLLARAESRRPEIAIRGALGAGQWRLLRQMLTEGAVLAVGGAALAVVFAWWGIRAVRPLVPHAPAFHSMAPAMDGRVFGFTLAVALLTALAFGLWPALQGAKAASLAIAISPKRGSAGRLLMISELAVAIVLLIGAALMAKSLWRLESILPGFRPDHLLTMQVWLPKTKYPDRVGIRNFYQQMLRRLDVLPGVKAAAAVNFRPFLGMSVATALEIQGRPRQAGETPPVVDYLVATPGYLRALGVPFLEGRDLVESDGPNAAGAVVVNQTAARRLWPNESPIGKQIRPRIGVETAPWNAERDPLDRWLTVVGVVGNIKEYGLNDREHAEIYLSYQQFPSAFMFLLLRTDVPPATLASAVKDEVLAVDHDQPVSDVRTMDSAIRDSAAQPRLNAELLGLFVLVAVFLAAAGVYGVMSYVMGQRAREMAVRMALGADPWEIRAMVLRQVSILALTATGIGLGASAWLARAMKSLLFDVAPVDPAIFAGASVVLFAVALAACYLPARRASRVDPAAALKL